VVPGLVWATYAAMLGYVGGRTFEERPFLLLRPLLLQGCTREHAQFH